jgi:peptidoglycan/xylan/chitin deacetylase (PgdA/CDA1 family)
VTSTVIRAATKRFLAPLLVRRARVSSRRRGLVLVYHAVAPERGDPVRELVPAHAVSHLEAQLRYLKTRYRVVASGDLLEAVASRRRGEPIPVAITFDDDLQSHLVYAAPALRRLGLTATFFLTGASLDAPHPFWWERLQTAVDRGLDIGGEDIHRRAAAVEAMRPEDRRRFSEHLPGDVPDRGLDRKAVRALVESGFTIGFHTVAHDRLPDLDDAALERAFQDGRAELEAVAGPLTSIAYPHGKADERVAQAARSAGFRYGFTGRYEAVRPDSDPYLLGRIAPGSGSLADFAAQIAAAVYRAP